MVAQFNSTSQPAAWSANTLMMTLPTRVLYVEDNPEHADLILSHFQAVKSGIDVHWRNSLLGGMDALAEHEFDVVLLDLGLPELSGDTSFKAIQIARPKMPVVIWTGGGDRLLHQRVLAMGAKFYLEKAGSSMGELEQYLRIAAWGW